MIIAIQEQNRDRHSNLVDQMYHTRKTLFADKLKWEVPVLGNIERDPYDDMAPIYLILTDESCKNHFASMRLLPTTGPTLLHDIFAETMPDPASLTSPTIWECTRFCVDESRDQFRKDFDGTPASSLLLLGLCELGLAHGIDTIAANFDPIMRRVYKKAGCEVVIHGQSDAFGNRPVAFGTFEVSVRILKQMRKKMNIHQAILNHPFTPPRPAVEKTAA